MGLTRRPRGQVVWQVRTWQVPDLTATDLKAKRDQSPKWETLVEQWQPSNLGKLKVRLEPEQKSTNPCTISPSSAYRGQENQLYRVEIHAGGVLGSDHAPAFKWSRENGSVVAAWLDTDRESLLVDSTRRFEGAQWVELLDDTTELQGEPGTLVKVAKVEAGIITIDPTTASGSINSGRLLAPPAGPPLGSAGHRGDHPAEGRGRCRGKHQRLD